MSVGDIRPIGGAGFPCDHPEPDTFATGEGTPGYCICGEILDDHGPEALATALDIMSTFVNGPLQPCPPERLAEYRQLVREPS